MVKKSMLSVLLMICGLGGVSAPAQNLPPELIHYPEMVLYNGRILTANETFDITQAVAIRDGRFLAVGENERILSMSGPQTVRRDLKGKMVVPGFIRTGADGHFPGGDLYKATLIKGKILGGIKGTLGKLDELKTKQQILAKLAEFISQATPRERLFIRPSEEGADIFTLTLEDLDRVAPNNPVAISVDSNSMVINSRMLELLTERIPLDHPAIVKDGQTGKPNGHIFGHATGVVGWDLRPWPKIDDAFLDGARESFQEDNTHGVTTLSGHIEGFSLAAVSALWHRKQLTVRIRAAHQLLRQNAYPEDYLRRLGNLVNFGLGDGDVVITGLGLAPLDGNHENGSALTLEPKLTSGGFAYGPHGQNKWIGYGPQSRKWDDVPPEERAKTEWQNIQAAVKYGWTFGEVHNVGDGATEIWLDAIETALQQDDIALPPQFGRPFSLDHNLFWNDQQDERVKKLDVRRALGTMFNKPQRNLAAVEIYGDRFHDAQPVSKLIEKGMKVHLAAFPPLRPMQLYITRKDEYGRIWGPEYGIDRETALLMVTRWAARSIGEDDQLGSIEPGKLADLTILGEDYLTVPEDQISQIPVLTTVVGGRIVYDSSE